MGGKLSLPVIQAGMPVLIGFGDFPDHARPGLRLVRLLGLAEGGVPGAFLLSGWWTSAEGGLHEERSEGARLTTRAFLLLLFIIFPPVALTFWSGSA
ncbi:hypothetical protein [Deinococcus peraridilitoris]|uniref:hypothetical protein n=1 Tax=Deinococcus peraridilitoris TaxID=432329 RepID=UPI00059DBBED|nr:hypothetical protein [Deinococcus peraridilitoris]